MDGGKPEDVSSRFYELFEEGKGLTRDLLKENERLRYNNLVLKNDIRELEKICAISEISKLKSKVTALEEENDILKKELSEQRALFSMVENENKEFAERYVRVESQNSHLINLYVASYRLHSTLNYPAVVTIIKEIVINLIGAEVFGVYIVNKEAGQLELIAEEGLEDQREAYCLSLDEGILGNTATTGDVHIRSQAEDEFDTHDGEDVSPLACFPLKVNNEVMGVIAIYRLLLQKIDFQPIDFELFNLLSGHAATALYGAQMYTLSERKRSTLEGFVDLLKEQ